MSSRAIAAAVVCFAALALYAPTIHDYFVQDDFGVVGLFSQRSLAYFPRWFVSPWTEDIWGYVPDEIRPFPAASYVIASWFGATAPEPNHVLNIALHAFNGVLVMWIAEAAAGLGPVSSTVAGLLFVVLPIQAESVAWITGRVDSLPTLFYFSSFLLYVRSKERPANYVWSLGLFFAALFSKQNTITMVPALMLFDWIVRRRRIGITWAWLRPYVPYVVLTVGFLAVRFVLFHEVARESILSTQRVGEFLFDSSRHLARLVFGGPGIRPWSARDTTVVALGIATIAVLGRRIARSPAQDLWRPAIYFGLVWVALGMLPILVSGYYSPRHMYLASLGWAVTLGIGLETLWRASPARVLRPIAITVAIALAVAYARQLVGIVGDWNHYAAISRAAVEQIEREGEMDPAGTLVIAGVPRLSWAFAIPHSVRPPFTPSDLTTQLSVISDSFDHCCNAALWNRYTRDALRRWHDDAGRPPVVVLYWDARTGRMSRVSDRDDPQLRTVASLLLETRDRASLDSVIQGLFRDYVALR
jgi:hypothetical protein